MINTNLTDFDQVYKLGNMVCIFLKLSSLGFLLREEMFFLTIYIGEMAFLCIKIKVFISKL